MQAIDDITDWVKGQIFLLFAFPGFAGQSRLMKSKQSRATWLVSGILLSRAADSESIPELESVRVDRFGRSRIRSWSW